ncbi:MAG TPA: hypothetical protein VFV46_08795 [Lacibacter sp.]|nr:hypothetical protein [Lacibacter sp.]
MNAKLLFLSLSLPVMVACKKKGDSSKPDIKLKDVKVQQVTTPNGSGTLLDIDIEVNDKEGDVRDSVFIMKLDAAGIPCPANTKDLSKNVPLYPEDGKQTVTFRIKFSTLPVLDYVNLGGSACSRKDTSRFQIWVKDRAGNRSDTVLTDRIGL